MITIYHNNRCSKSRECLDLIKKNNINYTVIEYLKNDFNLNHVKQIVNGLEGDLKDLIRINEKVLKDIRINFSDKNQIIELILKYRVCMQRPIIFTGKKYIICRPPDKVLNYL
jgi:arsenate reductase